MYVYVYLIVISPKDPVKSKHFGSRDPNPPLLGRDSNPGIPTRINECDLLPPLLNPQDPTRILRIVTDPQHDFHLEGEKRPEAG